MNNIIQNIKSKLKINKKQRNAKRETKQEKRLKEIIIIFVIIFISLIGKVMTDNINNLDTMWTFGFCQKIALGYIPYRDYNMVITPLFAQITALFFKIFSAKMIVFNFVGILETTIMILFEYLIFRKKKISKRISVVCMFATFFYPMNFATNSYNILACMFLFILYYVEICKIRYEKYIKLSGKDEKTIIIFRIRIKYTLLYNIFTGILLGLIFLSKQNIGVYAIIAITLYYFLKSILLKQMKFKDSFLQLVIKAIFCILPITIECMYLYSNGALYNFIDYCFLGIGTFNEKIRASLFDAFFKPGNLYLLVINATIITFIIITPIILIMKIKKKIVIKNRIDTNILLLSFFMCLIGVAYSIPLANEYHMFVTKYICIFMILLNILSINSFKKSINNSISKISYLICIVVPIVCSILYVVIYNRFLYTSKLEAFEYTYFPINEELNILAVSGYVIAREKVFNIPVIIATSNSTVFNIIRGQNGGIFELPLHGNMGKKDYENAINKLKEFENTYDRFEVLIYTNDDYLFWQDAKQLPQYIRRNYTKIDEFMNFAAYVFEKNTL